MKKQLFYSLLIAGSMCLTTACGDDDDPIINGNTPGTPVTPPSGSTIATDTQAQQELDRVGKALMAKIDADRFRPLVELAIFCDETFNDDYETDYDPYPYYSPSHSLNSLLGEIKTVARGNIARLSDKRMMNTIYQLSDYYATYTWNEETEDWDETENNNGLAIYFKHNGTPCECIVTPAGNTYTWTWHEGGESTTVKIPATVTATIKEGNNELARLVVNTTECNQSAHKYAVNARLDAAGYAVTTLISDNDNSVQAQSAWLSGNETLLATSCTISGRHLGDENYFDDDFDANANLNTGTMTMNLMGSVQINITADNSTNVGKWLDYDGDYYYNEYLQEAGGTPQIYTYSDSETAKKEATKALEVLQQYTTSNLVFTNGNYNVPIRWELVNHENKYNYPFGNGGYSKTIDGYWEPNPVMAFNGATYTFDTYFDDIRFSSLIDTFYDWMEEFEKLAD